MHACHRNHTYIEIIATYIVVVGSYRPRYGGCGLTMREVGGGLRKVERERLLISSVNLLWFFFSLNWTLYLEVPSLIVGILFVFALCVTISIGNVTTCNSIKSYHKCRGE